MLSLEPQTPDTQTMDYHLANKCSSYGLVVQSKVKVLVLIEGRWIIPVWIKIICNDSTRKPSLFTTHSVS